MLTKVTLENFFSFGKATTIELNPGANFLIGINASGKSNFFKALRLLKVGVVKRDLKHLFGEEWRGWKSMLHSGTIQENVIKLSYEYSSYDNVLLIYELSWTEGGKKFREVLKFANIDYPFTFLNLTTDLLKEEAEGYLVIDKAGKKEQLDIDALSLDTGELYLGQLKTTSLHVKGFLSYIKSMRDYNHFDMSPKSGVRFSSQLTVDDYLTDIGTNLAAVLSKIEESQPFAYEEIQQQLKKINPQFEELVFHERGEVKHLAIKEKHLKKEIPIEHLSDGTLHFLLMLCIFYNPDRGKVLVIEELELGLHPKAIGFVGQAIKYAAEDNTQLFIVTHSPMLLNGFELEDVYVFQKTKQNQTQVLPATTYQVENTKVLLNSIW